MSTFWWEDTYDPNLKVDTSVKTRIPTDNTGEAFLKHRILTSSSQLSGLITPNGALSIVLGDSGRIHSAATVYSNGTGDVVRTILVESKSGFMDLSSDGEILAVGLLKEVSSYGTVLHYRYTVTWHIHTYIYIIIWMSSLALTYVLLLMFLLLSFANTKLYIYLAFSFLILLYI